MRDTLRHPISGRNYASGSVDTVFILGTVNGGVDKFYSQCPSKLNFVFGIFILILILFFMFRALFGFLGAILALDLLTTNKKT